MAVNERKEGDCTNSLNLKPMFFSLHHTKGKGLHPTTLSHTNIICEYLSYKNYRGFSGSFIELHVTTATKKPLKKLQFWALWGPGLLELHEQIPHARSPSIPLEGQVLSDGKVFIHLCNYIEPWENLSFLQRESLNHHYHLNCGCQVREYPFARSFGDGGRVLSLAVLLFVYSFLCACIYSTYCTIFEICHGSATVWSWRWESKIVHSPWSQSTSILPGKVAII